MLHVDDFIATMDSDEYASWFFALHRMPSFLQIKFRNFIDKYDLYCTYKNKQYRVTGCSRMGDVWLTTDFNQKLGYELRVDVNECSNFTKEITK